MVSGGMDLNIIMAGVDHTTADIAQRERFAFTKTKHMQALTVLRAQTGVSGAVLLCTCNRTELYLSLRAGARVDPAMLLAHAAGLDKPPACLIQTQAGIDAARHLMEVACGLRSALRGDDQILTQVRKAIEPARAAHAADPILETLFRLAVTAAKQVKTEIRLRPVPVSAAGQAVEQLKKQFGTLKGHRALVIGNGEMGRAAANLLTEAGCAVTVTLRSYRHGETIVPYGCATIPYDARMQAAADADILLSATASPHFTFTKEMAEHLPRAPRRFIDLALPRDIDPAVTELPGVSYENLDTIGGGIKSVVSHIQLHRIEEICRKYLQQFIEWQDNRMLRETVNTLTRTIHAQICASLDAGNGDGDELDFAVRRTVETLLFSMKEKLSPELLLHMRQAVSTMGCPKNAR